VHIIRCAGRDREYQITESAVMDAGQFQQLNNRQITTKNYFFITSYNPSKMYNVNIVYILGKTWITFHNQLTYAMDVRVVNFPEI